MLRHLLGYITLHLARLDLNYAVQVILVHNVCHSAGISFEVIDLCETLSARQTLGSTFIS